MTPIGVAVTADLWQMSTWATRAACSGDGGSVGDWDAAVYTDHDADVLAAVCLTCPVASPCLELALVVELPVGFRGGLTPDERAAFATDPGALSQEPELLGDHR